MPDSLDSASIEALWGFFKVLCGIVAAGLGVICKMLWSFVKSQRQLLISGQENLARKVDGFMRTLSKENGEIAFQLSQLRDSVNKEMNELRSELKVLEGKALTVETLKRMELFLQAKSSQDAESAIGKAISLELKAREREK